MELSLGFEGRRFGLIGNSFRSFLPLKSSFTTISDLGTGNNPHRRRRGRASAGPAVLDLLRGRRRPAGICPPIPRRSEKRAQLFVPLCSLAISNSSRERSNRHRARLLGKGRIAKATAKGARIAKTPEGKESKKNREVRRRRTSSSSNKPWGGAAIEERPGRKTPVSRARRAPCALLLWRDVPDDQWSILTPHATRNLQRDSARGGCRRREKKRSKGES